MFDTLHISAHDAALIDNVERSMPKAILTVRQFSEANPAFSEASLRNLIFHAKPRHSSKGEVPSNGLEQALVRVGRRVLIDEALFFDWLDSQRVAPASHDVGSPQGSTAEAAQKSA